MPLKTDMTAKNAVRYAVAHGRASAGLSSAIIRHSQRRRATADQTASQTKRPSSLKKLASTSFSQVLRPCRTLAPLKKVHAEVEIQGSDLFGNFPDLENDSFH